MTTATSIQTKATPAVKLAPTCPTSAELDDVDQAAADYLAAFTVAIDTDDTTDLDAQTVRLRSAFRAAGDQDGSIVKDILTTAATQLQSRRSMAHADNMLGRSGLGRASTQYRHQHEPALRAAIRSAVDAVKDGELIAAGHALAEVRTEYQTKRNQLAQAVATADVDTVMRLRVEIEVGMPKRLADAELVVAEHAITRAQADTEATREVINEARLDLAERVKETVAVQEALKLAEFHQLVAQDLVEKAEQAATIARGKVSTARRTRDELTAQHATETTQRQAHIAGEAAQPESEPLFRRYLP
jgi:hypothetical protein